MLDLIKRSALIISTVFILAGCSSDDRSSEDVVEEVEAGNAVGYVITVNGALIVDWPQGFDYIDAGAMVYDEGGDFYVFTDGDSRNIDTSILGEHTVTFSLIDSEGNETVATRTVNVFAPIPFITTWTTTESNQSIRIPIYSFNTYYDFSIDWGDGSQIDENQTDSVTHIYSTAGTYTVSITGIFPHMYNDENSSVDKLMSVEQWGNIRWSSMRYMFRGAHNLVINATDAPVLSDVESMYAMFYGASSFNTDISHWDVSNVTDMSVMFYGAAAFNQPIDGWDVSNVTNMVWMFFNAAVFNQPLNSWDVSNVTDMSGMFYVAAEFNQPIDSWDASNVTNMSFMFQLAESFNQPIDSWDVSNVTDMSWMFGGTAAFNQPLDSWDVSNVTDMSGMFAGAGVFNQPLDSWDVSRVTNMSIMFHRLAAFNQPLDSWDVSNVTDMESMFSGTTAFNQPLDSWDVSNVTTMINMLNSSGLSTDNYDALLNGWSIQILQPDLIFDVSATYSSSSQAARQSIIDTYNWTINDDGLQP
ncbi:hypothetical protein GCM10008107_04180 [Psychrosphaera saromensis]|nr:BspA family leucine-rich repeat surface protein [Psychrosphaera saromensis]GHB58376.1 hypothetical protein GCM10008107_04180 [Psychrosphaera saromensis]GLQ14138.1 hypothetical protein GCM10007917_15930 [Psychrosphaera saromensis]